jgi:hypothetical protein
MSNARDFAGSLVLLFGCAACAVDVGHGVHAQRGDAPQADVDPQGQPRLTDFPPGEVPAVMRVADQAGFGPVCDIHAWGPNYCVLEECEQVVKQDLTRRRYAAVFRRQSDEAWIVINVSAQDFAHVHIGEDTLRIMVGGTDPPDPPTVRRLVPALEQLSVRWGNDEWTIRPEDVLVVNRPPEHPYLLAELNHSWVGSEFEIILPGEAGYNRVVFVDFDDGEARIIGAAVEQEWPH